MKLIGFAALAVAGAAQALQTADPAADAALVGHWQQGLTAQLRRMPQAERDKTFSGDILAFAADHTVRLYPKCGRERTAWEQHGFPFVGGTWEVVGAHKLHVVLNAMGKSLTQDTQYDVTGDELVFIGPKNPHELMGRYDGALPQPCPAGASPRS